jgi:flavin-dependent dehydrogenase
VRRVGFFCGDREASAPMPAAPGGEAFGRAVGRDILDSVLLDQARANGAEVFQPCALESWRGHARHRVDARGSWHRQAGPRDDDLLGFKVRFEGSALPAGLMPLVLFPGGYGGLVHTDGGLVSFSCCIRRDVLRRCREEWRGLGAGEAVLAHAMRHCAGVRDALSGAWREGPWLAAGPMRPGVRVASGGALAIGNAAGEAHPLVAEGISMAIQSAWLLAEAFRREDDARAIAARYAASWQGALALRVRASQVFSLLASSRATLALARSAICAAPGLLAWGAAASGKARPLAAGAP